jgi:hypothetical protein
MLYELSQELSGALADIFVVQTQSGKAARRAGARDSRVDDTIIRSAVARVCILVKHPLRRGGDHLRDHDLDPVLRSQIHHAIIIAPVVFIGRGLDRRPHEPMAERVHAGFGGGLVVARPILLRRIGLAKVHRAVWKHRVCGIRQCGAKQKYEQAAAHD